MRATNPDPNEEISLATAELADDIEICRAMVRNYRAILIDGQFVSPEESDADSNFDLA